MSARPIFDFMAEHERVTKAYLAMRGNLQVDTETVAWDYKSLEIPAFLLKVNQ